MNKNKYTGNDWMQEKINERLMEGKQMEYTKGPWNVEKVTFRYAVVDNAQNGTWELVAETSSAANANLIASAPEMLEELKFISQTLAAENNMSWDPYIKQIDELVKKATKG